MTQKEAMSLLEASLSQSNYSGKVLTPLGLLSALSNSQTFLGNFFRLKTKEFEMELVADQTLYVHDPEGDRDLFPLDILEFKNVIYNGGAVLTGDTRELKKYDMSSVVNALSRSVTMPVLGYAFEEGKFRLNFLPPTSYAQDNNETVTLRYSHKFIPYAGLDNYDWEVLPDYSKKMVLDDEYIPFVVQYATLQLSKEPVGSLLELLMEIIPRMKGETISSSLRYHLGVDVR